MVGIALQTVIDLHYWRGRSMAAILRSKPISMPLGFTYGVVPFLPTSLQRRDVDPEPCHTCSFTGKIRDCSKVTQHGGVDDHWRVIPSID